jgi:hypothetical protein
MYSNACAVKVKLCDHAVWIDRCRTIAMGSDPEDPYPDEATCNAELQRSLERHGANLTVVDNASCSALQQVLEGLAKAPAALRYAIDAVEVYGPWIHGEKVAVYDVRASNLFLYSTRHCVRSDVHHGFCVLHSGSRLGR